MSYDIIVRFKTKEERDEFCSQMCDGWGEGFCDFTPWFQKPDTDGTKNHHFQKVKDSAPEGTDVYYVNSVFEHM